MSKSSTNSFNQALLNNKFDQKIPLRILLEKLFLETTKFFLECFQTKINTSHIQKKFKEECPLFCEETQIPDSYEKLKKPYNRNLAFYIKHGPHGGYFRSHQFFKNVKQNFYPQFPMQLSPFCELEMKTNNTFAKDFEVKKVEPSEEEKEEISNNKNNETGQVIKELNLDDIFGINTTHIQRYNNIIQHPLYDVFVKIPGKMWKIKVQTEDGTTLYGPFMTEFIYNFIGKYYEKWEDEHPEMLNGITILVFDIVSDVHYLPRMLKKILDEQKEKAEKSGKNFSFTDFSLNNLEM